MLDLNDTNGLKAGSCDARVRLNLTDTRGPESAHIWSAGARKPTSSLKRATPAY